MKTNKSFGEFMLNVWAAILRVLFPRYCVKSLILKTNKNAEKYLLGVEKELRLIDKFQFSGEEIAARVWSQKTKVALLSRGSVALLSEVKTEVELDAVIATHRTCDLVTALRVYTPSREKMRMLCASLKLQVLMTLAQKVPSVFDSLTPLDILGVKEEEKVSTSVERWDVALELAKVRPAWALTFLKVLRVVVPSQLGEKGHKLMLEFFNIAFEAKVDISEMMPYLSVFFPELYTKVRENHDKYEKFSSFFVMMFPQLLKFLKKEIISSMNAISISGIQQPNQDVYAWLRIGYERMRERQIYDCIQTHLGQIRAHVVPGLFVELLEKMVSQASDFYSLVALYPFSNVSKATQQECLEKNVYSDSLLFLRTTLQERMILKVEESWQGRAPSLSFGFPFTDWGQKYAERAVVVMVKTNTFPSKRLNELSSELREVALREMEKKSQINAIKNYERVSELIYSTSLYPEAEQCFLALKHPKCSYDDVKQEYVQKVCMKEATVQWLLTGAFSVLQSFEIEKFLYLHAKQWGISQEQYCMLVQGKLSHIAPFLLKYVKAENGSDANAI